MICAVENHGSMFELRNPWASRLTQILTSIEITDPTLPRWTMKFAVLMICGRNANMPFVFNFR